MRAESGGGAKEATSAAAPTSTHRTDWAGRRVCQVVGCDEAARPWSYILPEGSLEVEVAVCPRHERELMGS